MSVAKIAVSLILTAVLVGGVAMGIMAGVNTSTWGATEVIVWGFVSVIAIAGILIGLLQDAGLKIKL